MYRRIIQSYWPTHCSHRVDIPVQALNLYFNGTHDSFSPFLSHSNFKQSHIQLFHKSTPTFIYSFSRPEVPLESQSLIERARVREHRSFLNPSYIFGKVGEEIFFSQRRNNG